MRNFNFIFGLAVFLVAANVAVASDVDFSVSDAVWQWSAEVSSINDSSGTNAHPRAFLWIPENCKKVRAVVFAQNNMIEEGILQHPKFRAAMAVRTIRRVGRACPLVRRLATRQAAEGFAFRASVVRWNSWARIRSRCGSIVRRIPKFWSTADTVLRFPACPRHEVSHQQTRPSR